eukprot:5444590-Pleurochrysis_carterae.AAC.1
MLTVSLPRSPPRQRAPARRTQATDGRHIPTRPPLSARPLPRALLAIALVLTNTASGTDPHAYVRHPHSSTGSPLLLPHTFRAPKARSTNFSIAADSLETAAC